MNKFKIFFSAALISVSAAGAAHAATFNLQTSKAFVGLNWTFGTSSGPEYVVGFVTGTSTLAGPNTCNFSGVKVSMHFSLAGGFAPLRYKMTGLHGTNTAQAEVGFGYSVVGGGYFSTIGTNTSYAVAGADMGLGTVSYFNGVHNIGAFGCNIPD